MRHYFRVVTPVKPLSVLVVGASTARARERQQNIPLQQFYHLCQPSSPVHGGLVYWRGGHRTPDGCERPLLQGLYQIPHQDFGAAGFAADGQ